MGWIYVIVLMLIALIVIASQISTGDQRDKAFVIEALKLGLTKVASDWYRNSPEGFGAVYGKALYPPAEYFPIPGTMVYGVIDGWETIVWSFTCNSQEASHTGAGYRIHSSFAALSKPSRRLPRFMSGRKPDSFQNLGEDRLNEGAVDGMQQLRECRLSVESDGRWLLFQASDEPLHLLGYLRIITDFANSVKTKGPNPWPARDL